MTNERCESELWDFKETLDFWVSKNREKKKKKKLSFCEHISAFANNKGGIIILGISDKSPREIKGLNYIENKINQLDRIIHNFTDYNRGFVKIKPISLKSKEGEDKDCIVVIISQTKECIAVKDKNKNYSYYFRISSGKEKRTFREIKDIKKEINRDNYKFINQLI